MTSHLADLPSVTRRAEGRLSYAASIANPVARGVGRATEALFGRRRLEALYATYRRDVARGMDRAPSFWTAAVERMNVRVVAHGAARVPAVGPLVVVANHPFGCMDGIALAHAIGRVRGDVMILAHEALARVPETRTHLLTVDFAGTREATRHNVRMRATALAHLRRGGALIVFPAGSVMTTPRPFAARAQDAPWGALAARLALKSRAAVLPVFVPGQNGRLFQIVSQFSQTLRYALLFHETARHVNGRIDLHVGALLPHAVVRRWGDVEAVTARLRERTFALAPGGEGGELADSGEHRPLALAN